MDNGTGVPARSRKRPPRTAESLAAEAQFRQLLDAAGAELLESEFLGVLKKHRVRCRAGHPCTPRPADARRNGTICITCAGRDPRAVEADFRARLADLGCTPVYEKYLGRNRPHAALCSAGHKCFPRPGQIKAGQGPCRICTGLDSASAEAAFRAALAGLGAVMLGEYRNAHAKVHVRCPAGHDCYPTGHSVQRGNGICLTCAGLNSDVVEARFLARLADLGATPLYEKWQGVERGHAARCAAGHACNPRPAGVRDGEGICRPCSGEWDIFYVVTGEPGVKFGITTSDPRPRLKKHAHDGYTEVVRLAAGLADGLALDTENAVKRALCAAGKLPVRGHEYFDVSCLALVLDVADSWLKMPAAPLAVVAHWTQEALFAA